MTSLRSHVYVGRRDNAVTSQQNYGILLKILDLTRNKFKNLDFLSEFRNLTSLILDRNKLDSDTILPHLPNLLLLWLNYSKVDELFPFIRNLQRSFPNLRFLSMLGNPAAPSYLNGGTEYEHLQYSLFVISWFRHLIHMYDRYVTIHERNEANRLFCRPFWNV
ncbi:leucine-rich melanocyte differentiation-associated protein-like [Schistocerca nitens]|uniref:leucine-rich melanocyte differentiation-associated protein-like n=1 Tax=Schistocerca nitens TaxID=7011 RepID=UPI00211780A7|nr:leucine-rich melanocyte differentiation-associated protein-like [Schistocerca nitens]